MSKWFDVEQVRAIVRDQLAEQGLPLHVEDPATRKRIADLIRTPVRREEGKASEAH